jgi:hypothetical protein
MIPKKIHWVWLSGEPVPERIQEFMQSWAEKCPDYEIILWDREKFPPGKCAFVDEAIARKRWAAASDYIRLYAVYNEGGIYLDSDVILYAPLDRFLCRRFFTAAEYFKEAAEFRQAGEQLAPDGSLRDEGTRPFTRHIGLQAAIFGAEKRHPFLADCMKWYNTCSDTLREAALQGELLAPFIQADAAYGYGFKYRDGYQELGEGMAVYPRSVFAGFHDQVTPDSVALHVCAGSWRGHVQQERKVKVLLAILYTKFVETECWLSLLGLERPEGCAIEIRTYARYSAAQGRNVAAKDAVNGGFDYLMFVDSDQVLPGDTLTKLLALGGDVRLAWTTMNAGRPETCIAVYDPEKRHYSFLTAAALPQGVFEADGGGLAVSLIKTGVFNSLESPYFRYIEYANGDTLSEDLNFCLAVKGLGKSIQCDPAVRAGHIKHITI